MQYKLKRRVFFLNIWRFIIKLISKINISKFQFDLGSVDRRATLGGFLYCNFSQNVFNNNTNNTNYLTYCVLFYFILFFIFFIFYFYFYFLFFLCVYYSFSNVKSVARKRSREKNQDSSSSHRT